VNPSFKRRLQIATSLAILAAAVILSYYSVVEVPNPARTSIYLVLDVSGSMNEPSGEGTKLDGLKASASRFVETLGPRLQNDFSVGVIAFDGQPFVLVRLTHDQSELATSISSLEAGGPTALGDALDLAVKLLVDESQQGDRRVALLMTDGLSNSDRTSTPEGAADAAAAEMINVYTVAFGSDADTRLLKEIADKTRGEYYFAATGEELVKSFTAVAKTLLEVSAPAHYGSRAMILAALVLVIFLPQVEKGITRVYTKLTSVSRVAPSTKTRTCPRCERTVQAEALYCKHCGFSFSRDDVVRCRECGATLRTGATFCRRCGSKV